MKPNIKKLLILNAPYLLFVWLFMKIGEAFRLSPGADLSGKLLHIMEGVTAAFEKPFPSLNGQDFLIGVAGAVILRLAVYMKGKNAKKYRKGVEYGSARWGNAKDIEPYIDPDFYNNVLLTQTERLTMNSRPKSPKYARNKNVLVIGGSGSGKTRFFVKPNLMQMHSSYCVTDPNGTWRIQYRWTDWTGTKRKSQKRGFQTKKEAEEWYARFLLQQSSDPTMTLTDFWEIYKTDMEKRLRKTTMKQKEYVMKDKVLPYFGKTPINEITAPMIRKWQGEMMEKGFRPTYLKTIQNQLSAIMNYAVNFYELRSNPCRKAGSMGKSRAEERPYWTLTEFQKFSDAIMDKQDSWIAFQILFWTGIRLGELLALQVKDVNFEAGTITIDESLARIDGEDLITAPKTESSIRVITIHQELQEALKEYMATLYRARPITRLFAGRTKSFFEHEMERGIKLSGVKKITIHCTRHSHASMLVQMGFSPIEIAKRLGHGKVTTTIETYCHQPMDAQRRIADRLGKVERGEEHGV